MEHLTIKDNPTQVRDLLNHPVFCYMRDGRSANEKANARPRPVASGLARGSSFLQGPSARRLAPRSPCSERTSASGRASASVGRDGRRERGRKALPPSLPSLPSSPLPRRPYLLTYFLRFPHVVAVSAVRRWRRGGERTAHQQQQQQQRVYSFQPSIFLAASLFSVPHCSRLVQVGPNFGKMGAR